jgi:hypothetical protein
MLVRDAMGEKGNKMTLENPMRYQIPEEGILIASVQKDKWQRRHRLHKWMLISEDPKVYRSFCGHRMEGWRVIPIHGGSGSWDYFDCKVCKKY